MTLSLPRNLADAARQNGGHAGWVARLPATVEAVRRRWSLTLGEPFQPGGTTAWVAPARDGAGGDLVLKVAWRHPEAEHEAGALRVWSGDGAVRLHASERVDGETIALLLERCVPGAALSVRPEPEQDEVIAGLLRRLWVEPPPGHRFPTLQAMCDAWADEYEQKRAGGRRPALDPGVARAGLALLRSLPSSAGRAALLCTDLHAGNVLSARRRPWLVVDPKPHVGDPTYDAVQHLLNCDRRLRADPDGLVDRLAGLLELDAGRLRLWLFARCVQESFDWPVAADMAPRLVPA